MGPDRHTSDLCRPTWGLDRGEPEFPQPESAGLADWVKPISFGHQDADPMQARRNRMVRSILRRTRPGSEAGFKRGDVI